MRESGEEVLIQRPVLATEGAAPGAIRLEARALFVGIRQFHEGVREFDPAQEQFKALGDARVGWVTLGERSLGGGPMGKEGRVRSVQILFDPL